MATAADILAFLETIAPVSMKEDWDEVGLNCGRKNKPVEKILVALDPFPAVCREAAAEKADLLVTHHALLWHPGFITDETPMGECALFLMENGIAHINAHTNLDCAPGGVNDVLASVLGLQDVSVLEPSGKNADGQPWGLLRAGNVDAQSLAQFLGTVKEKLGCPGLRYADGGRPVHRVAVGGGACGSELEAALLAGCDTFVTADLKYNQFWDAKLRGLNLIDAGHFYTENPVCAVLAAKLRAAFPDIFVKISEKHRDCMKFFL